MLFLGLAFALLPLLGFWGTKAEARSSYRELSSTVQPVDVPYNISEFSLAAALAQESNCNESDYSVGDKVADSKLLFSFGNGDLSSTV